MLALSLALFFPGVLTVDDNGPADFSSFAEAVEKAVEGDTLWVRAGTYAGFETGKSLSILGQVSPTERVVIEGIVTIAGAARFTLAGVDVDPLSSTSIGLRLSDVPGRLELDDVVSMGLSIDSCPEVVASRLDVNFTTRVSSSRAMFVDCVFRGTSGAPTGSAFDCTTSSGSAGLRVADESFVTVAGSTSRGGAGGKANCGCESDTPGGPALEVRSGSTLVVRGSLADSMIPGVSDEYCGPVPFDTRKLHVVGAPGLTTTAIVSGPIAAAEILEFGLGTVVQVLPLPEPYLKVDGEAQPGATRRFRLFGPDGEFAALVTAFGSAQFALPGLADLVYLNPASLFSVTGLTAQGQDVGANHLVHVPADPALIGVELYAQAVFPGLPSALDPSLLTLTNPADIVVRF